MPIGVSSQDNRLTGTAAEDHGCQRQHVFFFSSRSSSLDVFWPLRAVPKAFFVLNSQITCSSTESRQATASLRRPTSVMFFPFFHVVVGKWDNETDFLVRSVASDSVLFHISPRHVGRNIYP
ncbi:unnamed protein product [Amoebophrya sp. A25]|nr:unnamed protein product [Amoebophrya sp. A25]|eukprot:GSA25T00019630001.1